MMSHKIHKTVASPVELLAPGGNLETAVAAFEAGADAVYCGLGKFNARRRAANFDHDEMAKLIAYAHRNGRKVHLTFNTLVTERELPEAMTFLAEIAELKPDAILVQDLGVLLLLRRYFPELTVHASTQMGIHNAEGVAFLAACGVSRVVLERQMTLQEVQQVAKASSLELEVFLHGSLCASLSGRCLFSSHMVGASGNRGQCKQPCRRMYFPEADNRKNGVFAFSPCDLNGLTMVEELRKLGIASLKIEGRLRGPDYVYPVVAAYRKLLDAPLPLAPETLAEADALLRQASSRQSGGGFYHGFERVIAADRLGVFGREVGRVMRADRKGMTVRLSDRVHLGDRLRLVPPDGGEGNAFTLIDLRKNGVPCVKAKAADVVEILGIAEAEKQYLLYKIGENGYDFTRRAAALPPAPEGELHLCIDYVVGEEPGFEIRLRESPDFVWRQPGMLAQARQHALTEAEVAAEFGSGVPERFAVVVERVDLGGGSYFLPASELKKMRRNFYLALSEAWRDRTFPQPASEKMLEFFRDYQRQSLKKPLPFQWEQQDSRPFEDLPGFCGVSEMNALRRRVETAYRNGVRRFLVRSLHGLELLKAYDDIEITAAPPLIVANSCAAGFLQTHGVRQAVAWRELPDADLAQLAEHTPLPLAVEAPRRSVLLATRLTLPLRNGTEICDSRGNRFRLAYSRQEKLTLLESASVEMRKNCHGLAQFADPAVPESERNTPLEALPFEGHDNY